MYLKSFFKKYAYNIFAIFAHIDKYELKCTRQNEDYLLVEGGPGNVFDRPHPLLSQSLLDLLGCLAGHSAGDDVSP